MSKFLCVDLALETIATYPDLAGKLALVTGASAGIGSATALALAANGARVVAVGRNAQALEATVELIVGRGGRALAAVADCTQERELAALGDRVRRELGVPDVLVPFAGGGGMPVATAAESGSHWREVVEVNLTSTFLTVAAFLPDLLERARVRS
jgi:3-oxoacyl-[acyl-carrier protein] reductase